jgi:hypothetical protein
VGAERTKADTDEGSHGTNQHEGAIHAVDCSIKGTFDRRLPPPAPFVQCSPSHARVMSIGTNFRLAPTVPGTLSINKHPHDFRNWSIRAA